MSIQAPVKPERHLGIDLLRIIAMLMVCTLHGNMFTGGLYKHPGHEDFQFMSSLTEAMSIIGVNVYALITGYMMVNARWKLERYLALWLQVAFYVVGIVLLSWGLAAVGVWPADNVDYGYDSYNMLLLFFGSENWYFASYSVLYFLLPFVNPLLLSLGQRRHAMLLLLLCVVLPVVNIFSADYVYAAGYNFVWLGVMYVLGAYVKLYRPQCPAWLLIAVSVLCIVVHTLVREFDPADEKMVQAFTSYTSLCTVAYAMCVFLLFAKYTPRHRWLCALITFFAPLTFGIFLAHTHSSVTRFLTPECQAFVQSLNYPWWISLAIGPAIFLAFSLPEFFRLHLFRLLRVDKWLKGLSALIERPFRGNV